jgi:hypothetical protein
LIRSDKGAYTATFEGTRCGAGEYIIYAWGYRNRTPPLRLAKQSRWRPLNGQRNGNYRQELAQDILCAGETPRRKYQIQQAVKGLYEAHNPFNNWVNDD